MNIELVNKSIFLDDNSMFNISIILNIVVHIRGSSYLLFGVKLPEDIYKVR